MIIAKGAYQEVGTHGKLTVFHCTTCNKTFQAKKVLSTSQPIKAPCVCNNKYYTNSHRRLFKALKHCAEHNLSLEEYDDCDKTSKEVEMQVHCKICGHSYEIKWGTIGKRGCRYCSKNNKPISEEYRRSQCNPVSEKLDVSYQLIDGGLSSNSRLSVTCNKCGLIKKPTIDNFIRGHYRCDCQSRYRLKAELPVTFYILDVKSKVSDSEHHIKFGITCDFSTRILSLNNLNKNHNLTLLYKWDSLGKYCREFESYCKTNFCISKNTLKSGFTECTLFENLPKLIVKAEEFFKGK